MSHIFKKTMRIICQSVFDIFLVVLFSETYVMFCFATYTTIICMNIAILLRKFLKTFKIVSLKCAFPTQFNIFFYPPIVPTVLVCPLDTSWNRRMKLCCWCAAFTFTFQTSLARGGDSIWAHPDRQESSLSDCVFSFSMSAHTSVCHDLLLFC